MHSKTKTVYYCDFCKKKLFVRAAMEKHEKHCTCNINRECRWNYDYQKSQPHQSAPLYEVLLKANDATVHNVIPNIREAVCGCPACMITVIRLSKWKGKLDWRYEDEVKAFNEELRRQDELSYV